MVESVKNGGEDYRERVLVSPCNHLKQREPYHQQKEQLQSD